jgi:hypothetical protein
MRRMAILLPPPQLNFLPSILCASVSGSVMVAAQIFPLCRLLPLTIVVTFCLPKGQKLPPMGTPFVLTLKGLLERGLKVTVLVGLWLEEEEVLPGQLLEPGEMLPGLEEVELQEGAAGMAAARVVGDDAGRLAAGGTVGRGVDARLGRGGVGRTVVGGGGRRT